MQVDKDVLITSMVMETVYGLGYLIYAAALLLAASMTTGIASKVMYVLSAALFLYVCVTFGGFRGMFSGVSDTGVKKGKA